MHCRGVGEPVMSYNDVTSTGASLCVPRRMKLYGRCNEQTKKKPMMHRQSDSRIVPVKVAKSTGGKPREG